ncbi:MAG: DnaK suppressor protein [Candidatus Carbobacillus altaicus]|uniref:DnaK suppressor protein n=1 Tax=Candidatus Carbonibacillus altaicus TaxID=2163959 RepID=A0A2R6Y332_9BACL|nr:MAG: DnaK suppressor protein [Candidatus Carbobacillus altaicus]
MQPSNDFFKELILRERQATEAMLQANERFGLANRNGETELSVVDHHPGDVASDLYEREKDVAYLSDAYQYLEEIDRALGKIERGTYGFCEWCGAPIEAERLMIVPTARYCIVHQNAFEQSRAIDEARHAANPARPVEEGGVYGLSYPEGDEKKEAAATDGEDIWQMVEHYGTSDTPSTYGRGEMDFTDTAIEVGEPVGYVDPIEGFLATDLSGRAQHAFFVRSPAYEDYTAHLDAFGEDRWPFADEHVED